MMSLWNAAWLDEPPPSGSQPERHFRSPVKTSRFLWALFSSEAGETWAGAFECGVNAGRRALIPFELSESLFVLADGTGYVVNTNTQDAVAVNEDGHFFSAVGLQGVAKVACTWCGILTIVSPRGIEWEGQVGRDSVTIRGINSGGALEGYDDDGHGSRRLFRLDLQTFSLL